jgi:hypothetical protein
MAAARESVGDRAVPGSRVTAASGADLRYITDYAVKDSWIPICLVRHGRVRVDGRQS